MTDLIIYAVILAMWVALMVPMLVRWRRDKRKSKMTAARPSWRWTVGTDVLSSLLLGLAIAGVIIALTPSHSKRHAPKADVAGFLAAWHQRWPGVPSSADEPLLAKAREVCAEPDASIVAQWREAQKPDPFGANDLIRFQLQTPLHYLCPAREGLLEEGAPNAA